MPWIDCGYCVPSFGAMWHTGRHPGYRLRSAGHFSIRRFRGAMRSMGAPCPRQLESRGAPVGQNLSSPFQHPVNLAVRHASNVRLKISRSNEVPQLRLNKAGDETGCGESCFSGGVPYDRRAIAGTVPSRHVSHDVRVPGLPSGFRAIQSTGADRDAHLLPADHRLLCLCSGHREDHAVKSEKS